MEGYFDYFPSKSSMARISRAVSDCSHFILCGADVLDGGYSAGGSIRKLLIAKIAEQFGAHAYIIGFSFSDRASNAVKRFLRKYGQGFTYVCRDPRSAERLASTLGRGVVTGADMAFMLPMTSKAFHPAAVRAEAVIADWRREGRRILAFNANPLALRKAAPNVSLDQAADLLASGLKRFADTTNCALLLLTHDNRPPHADNLFMKRIADQIPGETVAHFVPDTIEPTDIKRLCGMVDVVVTGRMHLGIAALGAGTPASILDYQGKVRGLLDLFDSAEATLFPEIALSPDEFSNYLCDFLKNNDIYRNKIREHLADVRSCAQRNLDVIFNNN